MDEKINIPFGDGNGFSMSDLPKEEKIEKNYQVVDNLIGVNEDGNHIIPDENDWNIIDAHEIENPNAFIPINPEQITEKEKRDDWEYYLENLKKDIKDKSMQDIGNIKTIKKGNDKVKKIGAISSAIFGVCILASAFSYTVNDIKTTFPGQEITKETFQEYVEYKTKKITNNYNMLIQKVNNSLPRYLDPTDSYTGAKPGETAEPGFYENQFPHLGGR